jgi:hypothetical protein
MGQFGHEPLQNLSADWKIFGNCLSKRFLLYTPTEWVVTLPTVSCGHATEAYYSVKDSGLHTSFPELFVHIKHSLKMISIFRAHQTPKFTP